MSFTTRNAGTAPIGPFRVNLFLAQAPNPAPVPGDGIGVGFKDFPGLAAGAGLASTLVVTLPESFVAGTYFLSAVADAGNAIPETNGHDGAALNGRTLQECTALAYGAGHPLPNVNMASVGLLERGFDGSLDPTAYAEPIPAPILKPLTFSATKGLPGAPSTDIMNLARDLRDEQLDPQSSFNQTFRVDDSATGWWVTPFQFGIDQGPVVLAVENYRTGLIWNVMRRCPYIVTGLRRAGFTGGWL